MKIPQDGYLLRIFIGESDHWQGKPLYEAIVLKAREVARCGRNGDSRSDGVWRNSRLHTTKILRLSEDLPMIVEIVDAKEKIDELMPHVDEMVQEGLVTLERSSSHKVSSEREGCVSCDSVVVASVNPHRLGLSSPLKTTLAVKLDRPAIGQQRMLMKAIVA